MLGVGHVVTTSVGMCDIDIRPVSTSFNWIFFSETPFYVIWVVFVLRICAWTLQPHLLTCDCYPRVCMAVWWWLVETRSFRASLTDWTENSPRKPLRWVSASASMSLNMFLSVPSLALVSDVLQCLSFHFKFATFCSSFFERSLIACFCRVWGWSW